MDLKRYSSELIQEGYFDSIVQGRVVLDGRRFQADTETGLYEDVDKIELGYRGPQSQYRKISDLEYDEIFLSKLKSAWIKSVCEHFIGTETSIMRVTMMNKPIGGGTALPWHQDVARHWPTTVQPELVIWFPLDDTNEQSGSLQIIPRSHSHGMIAEGHMLPRELENIYASDNQIKTIVLQPGDVLFFNPNLLHRSGINKSDKQRRAVNVVLLPGVVLHSKKNKNYPVLFGPNELMPNEVAKLTSISDL